MLKRISWLIGLSLFILNLFSPFASAVKIAFPSYIYPGAVYNQIISSGATEIVMFNPASGPGNTADPGYVAQLAANKAAGKKTYGYLGTGYFCAPSASTDATADSPYANRCPAATIQAGIDSWASFYPGLNGIFFDEADTGKYAGSSGTKQKWDGIIAYANSKGLKTIVNFGTDGYDTSLDALDAILVNYEGPASTYVTTTFHATGPKYYHIVYSVTTEDEVKQVVAKASQNAGYVHVTNYPQQSGAYTALPSNWASITQAVSGNATVPSVSQPTTPGSPTKPVVPPGSSVDAPVQAPVVKGPKQDCDKQKIDETNCDIVKYINLAFNFVSGGVVLAVIGNMILAGIQYSMSQGDPSNVAKAKSRIVQGFVAFLMYMTLAGFIQWLIPGGIF